MNIFGARTPALRGFHRAQRHRGRQTPRAAQNYDIAVQDALALPVSASSTIVLGMRPRCTACGSFPAGT